MSQNGLMDIWNVVYREANVSKATSAFKEWIRHWVMIYTVPRNCSGVIKLLQLRTTEINLIASKFIQQQTEFAWAVYAEKTTMFLSKRHSFYLYKYYYMYQVVLFLSYEFVTYTGISNFYIIIYTENNKNKLSPSINLWVFKISTIKSFWYWKQKLKNYELFYLISQSNCSLPILNTCNVTCTKSVKTRASNL